jgi:hypothetical protein
LSGNSLYLVCAPCSESNQKDYGFKLAERGIIGAYQVFGPKIHTEQFSQWLSKHRLCAGKTHPDHFKLAHLIAPDSDQPKRPMLSLKRVDGTEITKGVSPEIQ